MRALWCLALLAVATPVAARDPLVGPKAQYYGPLKNWLGIGYKNSVQKDGTWRVVSESRINDGDGFALNVAMYRAAELAREQGFRYVQMLSIFGTRSFVRQESVILVARPSASPAPPAGCKPKRCYTADVASVLTLLGGPAGNQPGVAVPSYLDEYGREVTMTGFGIGAASPDGVVRPIPLPPGARPIPSLVAAAAPPAAFVLSTPAPFVRPLAAPVVAPYRQPVTDVRVVDQPSYQDRLRAAQPVHGGNRQQGWTIGD